MNILLACLKPALYLHIFDWPKDGKLVVLGFKNRVRSAYLLADPQHKSLATENNAEGLVVTVPATAPDAISSTVVLKIKGAPEIQ